MPWIHFMRLLNAIGRWRECRTTIRRLSRFNDHLLKDIGIHRHEIASAAQQSAKSILISYDGQGKAVVLPKGLLMDLPRRR